ncbi:MAG: GntR family transcriptional regulator [Candidatus Bathyarchaeia archaeon]
MKEWLRSAIARGDYSPGDKVPSEHELAAIFNVSRGTARRALHELVLEGWLYKIQGKGTFVANKKFQQVLSTITSFSEDMHELGLTPGARVLFRRLEEAGESMAKALAIDKKDTVFHLARVRLANGDPMALNVSVLPYKYVPGIENIDLEHVSLYYVLEKIYNLQLWRSEYIVEPILADTTTAYLLKTEPGAPLLRVEGVVCLKNGTPIEWTEILYRGDKYKFSILALRRPSSC